MTYTKHYLGPSVSSALQGLFKLSIGTAAGSLVDHLKATEFASPTFPAPIDQVDCVIFQVMIDVWGSSDEVSPASSILTPTKPIFSRSGKCCTDLGNLKEEKCRDCCLKIAAVNPQNAANVP